MINKKKNVFMKLYIILICLIHEIYSIEISVKSEKNISDVIDDLNSLLFNQDINEIKLFFDDDNYKISSSSRNVIDVSKNIYFYSKNGTVFDFQNNFKNQIFFIYKPGVTDIKIVFKNITFYNFTYRSYKEFLMMFHISNSDNNFQIEFDNCTFMDIYSLLFYIQHSCYESTTSLPQTIFNNCKFM
ncbi:hypothetical protein H8356DRAFT_133586 [Neocallimastix lanati (nom. inval.)]|uniref:Uncharacterized protein n=1 Tax=Neocallimastix californiae TaxID=1754190 RepID=A0A1Y2ET09_9FUNG|nr:hypothetical protein H8356DRAFT_133586 [Neocallimastix sp. JGI-2020a]ORY74710.1 hypothetical protein LY90DRAFT_633408 [Neocallimastix californiae]|eukprot:ORY74710.1 hypothetical protein LY90DRAFT_633408 [Neocallimastix californiae]